MLLGPGHRLDVDVGDGGRHVVEGAPQGVRQGRLVLGAGVAEREGPLEVEVGQLVEPPAEHLGMGDSQQADGQVEAALVLGLRRVGRASGDVEDVAGGGLDGAEVVDLPRLGAGHLQHQHVVLVVVARQPGGAGRGQVGVGLHRVAGGPLEAAAEPGHRKGRALEALQHEGRPLVYRRGDAAHVRDVVEAGPADPHRGGGAVGWEGGAVLHEAEGGTARGRQQESLDLVDAQEVVEALAGPPVQRSLAPVGRREAIDVAHQTLEERGVSVHGVSPERSSGRKAP